MATVQISRNGFGQVEPNHMSGIITDQIYAQLPADTEKMGKVLEQGRFAKYDYPKGKVNLTGAGEWMMIYNEEQLYDERLTNHKDYAMQAKDFTDGEITPRLIKTNVGDIFTTNTFKAGVVDGKGEGIALDNATLGTKIYINEQGYLDLSGDENGPVFEVAKIYTMPDGQPGVKLVRIS